MALRSLKKFNNTDLTKIIYPIVIFLTGWYSIVNLYRIPTTWQWNPPMIIYSIAWALVPAAFVYIALRGVRLKFKWSVLSVVGIIIIVVFTHEAILLFMDTHIPLSQIFLTGQWDHTFFPLAFGLFFLCDLSKIPKRFWLLLLSFAIFNLLPNLNVIFNLFFDKWVLSHNVESGPPGFFNFFGAKNWEDVKMLSKQEFMHGLIEYLHEQLTFFTLFPIVIFYHLLRKREF